MKTRIMVILVILVIVIILVVGCAGQRSAVLKINDDGSVEHRGRNISLLMPDEGAIALAEASRIKKQGDILEKMYNGLEKGEVKQSKRGFLIALVNNDSMQMAYIYHPEVPGLKIIAEPNGGFGLMDVRDIPYEIVIYRWDGKIIKKIRPEYDMEFEEKISHKKQIGNLLVDYRITINKIPELNR